MSHEHKSHLLAFLLMATFTLILAFLKNLYWESFWGVKGGKNNSFDIYKCMRRSTLVYCKFSE